MIAHESVKDGLLVDLLRRDGGASGAADVDLHTPLLLIDTSSCDSFEKGDAGESKYNETEGVLVLKQLNALLG